MLRHPLIACLFLSAAGLGISARQPAYAAAKGPSVPMTCMANCRFEYGVCIQKARSDDPDVTKAKREACGHEYVHCSAKCKANGERESDGTP